MLSHDGLENIPVSTNSIDGYVPQATKFPRQRAPRASMRQAMRAGVATADLVEHRGESLWQK
jgi:hypothetical protein